MRWDEIKKIDWSFYPKLQCLNLILYNGKELFYAKHRIVVFYLIHSGCNLKKEFKGW